MKKTFRKIQKETIKYLQYINLIFNFIEASRGAVAQTRDEDCKRERLWRK